MGGGLMQLVAYGAQDIYLTSNPQITFFKVVYRRHTNFAIESIEQTFNGSVGFGNKVTCTVSRNGDLIHKVYLQADLPAVTVTGTVGTDGGATPAATTFKWADNIGHQLIQEVVIEIGGQQIDKHYGEWLTIWNELTQTDEKATGYNTMVGADLTQVSAAGAEFNNAANTATVAARRLYVPLQFWFCRNPGLALPLIAMQYHEVKFHLTFRGLADLHTKTGPGAISSGTPALSQASLYVDYIYLDTDERRQFAQVQHEYLIEQLQFTGAESISGGSIKSKLAFNHPVKELIWQLDGGSSPSFTAGKLQLNGHDRFSPRDAAYFNLVQPYQHHTRVPSNENLFVYSFALNPEQHQPSGTVNMSRIDNATLMLETTGSPTGLRVYASNYNILRVMSGMAGLAYSN
jgi:hypothetical protein